MQLRLFSVSALLCAWTCSHAADHSSVGITSTTAGSTAKAATATSVPALSAVDLQVAQMWGLTQDEMQRALVLLKGPRGAFSSPNLSPVEALGIHARGEQERRYYAQLYARAFVADVERVLAWSNVAEAEVKRLVGDKPVISFTGLPPVPVSPAVAAGANLPMSAVRPPAAAASKEAR
ncbi:MAG TPA: integrating conjugative element protein [Burkholderiaceae bacterium]|nr:integrating conjugative element protein [Burkholderiaceae bacterium]